MPRGTSPKHSPKKITIGDGSIGDLIKFLLGTKLPIKQGKRTISKGEIKEAIPAILKKARADVSAYKGRKDVEKYGQAYNLTRDYEGTYSTPEKVHGISPVEKWSTSSGYFPVSATGNQMGEFEGSPLTRRVRDRGRRDISRIYGASRYRPTPRGASPAYPTVERTEPEKKINPTDKTRDHFSIKSTDPREGFTDFYMGGPVRKRRKKRKSGGKMKKYAKGGGIRKPTYS